MVLKALIGENRVGGLCWNRRSAWLASKKGTTPVGSHDQHKGGISGKIPDEQDRQRQVGHDAETENPEQTRKQAESTKKAGVAV